MNAVHPKVKVPAIFLSVLTLLGVVLSAVAGTSVVPWAATIAAGVLTVVQFVSGYLTSSAPAAAPR